MRVSEDWIPNKALQRTPRLRLGWHVRRHWRGVSELGRSAFLTCMAVTYFPEPHGRESFTPRTAEQYREADILGRWLISTLGF